MGTTDRTYAEYRHGDPVNTGEGELKDRHGQTVMVLDPILPDEADLFATGPMYRVRFADGYVATVFHDELTPHGDHELPLVRCWACGRAYPERFGALFGTVAKVDGAHYWYDCKNCARGDHDATIVESDLDLVGVNRNAEKSFTNG